MTFFRIFTLFLTTFFLFACSHKPSQKSHTHTPKRLPSPKVQTIAPGTCLVKATLLNANQLSHYEKAPCTLEFKIMRVVGYGSGFSATISENTTVKIDIKSNSQLEKMKQKEYLNHPLLLNLEAQNKFGESQTSLKLNSINLMEN
jgi:hypothetical protein